MMEEEVTGRSSLDNQIREAKTRAELFSKSLQDARAQEAIALKILEQERERWAHSFEEKSIMIEQLERELTSTVEALDVERSTDKLPRAADLKEFTSSDVDQSFHDLMSDVNAHMPTLTSSFEYPAMRRTTDMNFQTRYSDAPVRGAFSTGPLNSHHSYTAQSAERSGPRVTTEHQPPKRAVSPVREKARTDDTAVWRDLLEQYQDQLKLSKSECIAIAEDKERLRGQVIKLEKQVAKLVEEKQLFATACEHAEGKLKFRVAQVIECEESKGILTKRVSELSSLNAELQSQLTSLRHELVLANTELRIHSTRTQNQALRETAQDTSEPAVPVRSQQEPLQPARASPQLQVVNVEPTHPRREPVHSVTPFLTSMSREDDGDFPYPARQRIQATEAYAKDLHRQLDEAHANYTEQLEDAKRTASSLQMLLKDSERRGDDLRTRCQAAEQGAAQYRTERDALLTMVSKLHLSETTKATNTHAYIAHQEDQHVMSREQSVFHCGDGFTSTPAPAVPAPTLGNKNVMTVPQTSSPPQVNTLPQSSPPLDSHRDIPSTTLDQRLSRSRDSVESRDALMARLAAQPSTYAAPDVELDDSYSVSDTESELSRSLNGHLDPQASATATQSVLFTQERIQRLASTVTAEQVTAANSTHAPILRMLSASGDGEGPSTRKRTMKRRTRSTSGEGKAVTKTTALTPPVVQVKKPTRSPAAAVGQPGKSMVIRKPASYTGAAGASTDKSVKTAATPAPSSAATKLKTANAKKTPSPASTKVIKAKSSTTKPTSKSSRTIQVHVPASYSNENDLSWGSDDLPQHTNGDVHGEHEGTTYPTDRELEDGMDGDSIPTISHLPLVQAPFHSDTVHGIAVQEPLQFARSAVAHHECSDPDDDARDLEEANDMLSRTMELVEIPDSHVAGGISYYEINRARSNSLHSVNSVQSVNSAVSNHTNRSVSVVESSPEVPPPAYSGVTEVKIRRKSAPGELVNRTGRSPRVATQAAAGHNGSTGKKLKPSAARTPSPMLRTTSAHSAPTSRTVKIVPSTGGSAARTPYTPASYSASVAAVGVPAPTVPPAVVTPTGSTSKVAKLLSAYGQSSLPKKTSIGPNAKSSTAKPSSLPH